MELKNLKYLVVGSGFFGSVIAERIASDMGERVLVIEKRGHIGGNSFSETDSETGIEYHRYGSHIFHTSDKKVWEYTNRFSSFNSYRHKVLTQYGGRVYQMPINLATINSFYGLNLSPLEAESFLRKEAEKDCVRDPSNLEEKAISLVGRPLYEAFVRGYTIKQWETDPRELPASVITRLPVRFSYHSDYFDDPWQGIPLGGYGNLFKRILDHKNIEVRLNTDYFDIRRLVPKDCLVIYTGPIDRFFDYRSGALNWRTLGFEKEVLPQADFQGTSVMNYAEASVPYTRIHEFRHLHPERGYSDRKTLIFREYSKAGGPESDQYYPVNTAKDGELLGKYQKECLKVKNVVFGGRLGSYKYLNMDQVIEEALATYEGEIRGKGKRK